VSREPISRWDFISVATAILVLELLVYRSYFTGAAIPQFDFMGAYNTEAFAWWRDGSFFSPAQWMPYMWGGYPSVSNLQNSSFYLPVGIASLFGPFTLHSSAVVSALHVAFGAVGMYVFVRAWGLGRLASLLGLVAWFFAAGFYSNASNLDIMRAWAWAPWVMLVASIHWPWRRWWGVVLAVLILWQTVLGAYPGILVAFLYTIPGWVLAQHFLFKPRLRRFLLPLILAAVASVMMTMVRFLPALTARGSLDLGYADASSFSFSTLGAILFPYDGLGQLAVFQSYFLPASLIAGLAFALRPTRLVAALIVPVVISMMLGLPIWPWSDLLTTYLPLFDLSRFRASDFKVILMFALAVLSLAAIDDLIKRSKPTALSAKHRIQVFMGSAQFVLGVMIVIGLAVIGIRYSFDPLVSTAQWALLFLCTGLIIALALINSMRRRRLIAALLVLCTAVSGVIAVESSPASTQWKADRGAAEMSYFGASVDSLITLGNDQALSERRPGRIPPPPFDEPQEFEATELGRTFYTGESSVYGYTGLRGTESYEIIKSFVGAEDTRIEARAFWSAAGVLISHPNRLLPETVELQTCATSSSCGEHLTSSAVSYSPGSFRYQATAARDILVSANEAYYIGWDVRACPVDRDQCRALDVTRGSIGQLSFALPRGTWSVEMEYRLPYGIHSWFLFWSAIGGILLWAYVVKLLETRGHSKDKQPQVRLKGKIERGDIEIVAGSNDPS
jgi:hypothetical protein